MKTVPFRKGRTGLKKFLTGTTILLFLITQFSSLSSLAQQEMVLDPTSATLTATVSYDPNTATTDTTSSSTKTSTSSTQWLAESSSLSAVTSSTTVEIGDPLYNFNAYNSSFTGGVRVASGDVNGDGRADLITGAGAGGGPRVKVFDGATGEEIRNFLAYSSTYTGGIFVASGDVNGDGKDDMIVSANGTHKVKVFDGVTGSLLQSFFAYASTYTGRVRVASGDVNGDGRDDIITSADGTHKVKVFDGTTGNLMQSFFAYSSSFTGAVQVASGDVNGDGKDDIITSAGEGRQVKAFDGATGMKISSFHAYGSSYLGAVRVAVADIDGDGKADIITSADGTRRVKVFTALTHELLASFHAYDTSFEGGIFLAAGDVNGDGRIDIITGKGKGGTPRVKVFPTLIFTELGPISPSTTITPATMNALPGDLRIPYITQVAPKNNTTTVDLAPRGIKINYDTTVGSWAGGGFTYDNFGTVPIETGDLSGLSELHFSLQGNTREAKLEIIDDLGNKSVVPLLGIRPDKEQVWVIPTSALGNNDLAHVRTIYFIIKGYGKEGTLTVNRVPSTTYIAIPPSDTLLPSDIVPIPGNPQIRDLGGGGGTVQVVTTTRGLELTYNNQTNLNFAGAGFSYDNFTTDTIETEDFSALTHLMFGIKGDTSQVKLEIHDAQDGFFSIPLIGIHPDVEQVYAIPKSVFGGADLANIRDIWFVVEGGPKAGTLTVNRMPAAPGVTIQGAYDNAVLEVQPDGSYIIRAYGEIFTPEDEVRQLRYSVYLWNGLGWDEINTEPFVQTCDPLFRNCTNSFVVLQSGETVTLSDELAGRYRLNFPDPKQALPNFVKINGEYVPLTVTLQGKNPLGWPQYDVTFKVPTLRGDGRDKIKFLSPYPDSLCPAGTCFPGPQVLYREYAINHDATVWGEIEDCSKWYPACTHSATLSIAFYFAGTASSYGFGRRFVSTNIPAGTKILNYYFSPDGSQFIIKTVNQTVSINVVTGS